MSESNSSSAELLFRPGEVADWPAVARITERTWGNEGDYIDEGMWRSWVADPNAPVIVATLDSQITGIARLSELGAAEWWLEAVRVDPDQRGKGIGRAIFTRMVELFRERGIGLLRFTTDAANAAMIKLATQHGFRHIATYGLFETESQLADYRNFKVLQPANLQIAHRYLRSSPMNRVNRFLADSDHWVLYYLTQERLAQCLGAGDQYEVLGWRQSDQLAGAAILHKHSAEASGGVLEASFVDAPDDTTLAAMLTAMRGIAARRGFGKLAWSVPLGVGLERAAGSAGLQKPYDWDIRLYELPLRL